MSHSHITIIYLSKIFSYFQIKLYYYSHFNSADWNLLRAKSLVMTSLVYVRVSRTLNSLYLNVDVISQKEGFIFEKHTILWSGSLSCGIVIHSSCFFVCLFF